MSLPNTEVYIKYIKDWTDRKIAEGPEACREYVIGIMKKVGLEYNEETNTWIPISELPNETDH